MLRHASSDTHGCCDATLTVAKVHANMHDAVVSACHMSRASHVTSIASSALDAREREERESKRER